MARLIDGTRPKRRRGNGDRSRGAVSASLRVCGLLALVAIVAAGVTTRFGFSTFEVASASMEPTLDCAGAPRCRSLHGDKVLVSSWIYRFRPVERGDIVVAAAPARWCGGVTPLVKRVVAVPGDTVEQAGGRVRVDGKLVGGKPVAGPSPYVSQRTHRELRLASKHYFLMGDNRGASCDSRWFGSVPRRLIESKVVGVYRPLRRLRLF